VVTHLYEHDEAMAVLKVGAGKTISTLTAIHELIADRVIRHALVIAPKRVANIVWPDEVEQWAHTRYMSYAVLDGTPGNRFRHLAGAGSRDLTFIGIDNVQWLVDNLAAFEDDHPIFDCLVIDETSKLKDPKSQRAKALASIAGKFRIRWGLTGTPRPNSLMDLFTPAKILTDGKLWGRSFYKWQRDHFYPTDYKGYNWAVLPHHEEQLLADAASISVTLSDGDMPPMAEPLILIDEVVLPDAARQAYKDMERELFTAIEGKDVLAQSRAVATGKLAQIANGYLYGEGGAADVSLMHLAKEEWLSSLVESLDGEPALLVYEYQQDMQVFARLFGKVPTLSGVSDEGGRKIVADWNDGKLPLLALHPASAGHGLNLQRGGYRQVWMSPPWSAELWEQTIGRLHRPGQKDRVMVHVCSARNTVDDLKRARVVGKLSAQAAFEAYLQQQVPA
jgi:hypothetical protein